MQQLGFYSPQWLYSTYFGRQSHPSSGVHMLYMATGKSAHLGCKFLLDVSVVNSPIVVELLVVTALFCVVLPAGSTTQNKAVITNNSTTIGLFTTDTSDKNLQPK